MRRWLAVLLLVLLPLQSSWAAVAAYCGHEAGAQAQHLGHHPHQHAQQQAHQQAHPDQAAPQGDAAPETGAAADSASASSHFDCSHCHASGASLPAPVAGLAVPAQGLSPADRATGMPRSLAQSPPERPQWAVLA